MAILQEDEVSTQDSVTRGELMKAIRRSQPYAVATDNLLELAPTEKGVIEFLSRIPAKVKVIQVTGSPVHGMTTLTALAKRHGFRIEGHPNPVETAIMAARLAALGVGTEVSALARETRIVVSRARTVGPGGFSQARFQRRMHGAIQQVARSVLDRLSRAGMDFDEYEKRTAHGWAHCMIHVYDSTENVLRIVQPEVNRIAGIAVRVSAVKHRSILYLPTAPKEEKAEIRRRLVVGLDAGITVGIAVADTTGELVALHSGKGMTRGEVIQYLVKFGTPVLIATDVNPAPTFVEKLSKSLNLCLFVPPRLLTAIEKRELASRFSAASQLRPTNSHQRDALSATAEVFQAFTRKLQQLHRRLEEDNQLKIFSQAAAWVLQGFSVHDAIQQSTTVTELQRKPAPESRAVLAQEEAPSPEELQKLFTRQRRQIESLTRQLEHEHTVHQQIAGEEALLKGELAATRRQLDRVSREEHKEEHLDARIRQRDDEISRLRDTISSLQSELAATKRTLTNLRLMRNLEIRGEVQPILVLPRFSQDAIRHFGDKHSEKRAKLVYILDASGGGASTAAQLIELKLATVIVKGAMSHLALSRFNEAGIPVIDAAALRITVVDEFAVVDRKQLEHQIAQWAKQHERSEHEAAAEALERLVEEYRQERRGEASGEEHRRE
jgi:predicted RNase H-like nuclease (RuvC/YqgF family)